MHFFIYISVSLVRMLCVLQQMLKDGTFVTSPQHTKLTYGAMMHVRCMIVFHDVAFSFAQAVTIAVRYSCVRRQCELKPGLAKFTFYRHFHKPVHSLPECP